MKIYLAGPMRGYENFNFTAFDYAAEKLRSQGHEVFSPADNDRKRLGELPPNPTGDETQLALETKFTIREAMRDDTKWICEEAEAIALLPGWEKSSGATAETALAICLGLTRIILGKEYIK